MKTAIELIGPMEAAVMLKGNSGNRLLDSALVASYAKEMLAGLWKMTFDSIGITPDGRLINGQHRLNAIIESGCSIKLQVMRDVEPDVYWRAFDTACANHSNKE